MQAETDRPILFYCAIWEELTAKILIYHVDRLPVVQEVMEEFRFVSFFVAVSVRPGNLEVEEGHDLQSKLKAHTVLQDQNL